MGNEEAAALLIKAVAYACVAAAVMVGMLFWSMTKWLKRLEKRDDDQQRHIDATDNKFRSLALMCPITGIQCPLQKMFQINMPSPEPPAK